ncbi:hypothetical protein LVJ94_04360 [Pendulispora rubella]|uniref:Uncharacterized protein n=1 Tax=Pendulispora rubella TaxID=2741070 RepID=A0ABZ2LB73_9BACT
MSTRRIIAAASLLAAVAASAACGPSSPSDPTNYCASTAVDVETTCQSAADCPGAGDPNARVTCIDSHCTFACKGEAYDVNGNTADGCEVVDPVRDNHHSSDAIDLGDDSCLDSSSAEHFSGIIATDVRQHVSPSIDGYDGKVGAAPDWYMIRANGGQCENDIEFELRVRGAAHLDRYRLHIDSDKDSWDCTTDALGFCRIKDDAGSYHDNTWIYIRISKVDAGDTISCAPEVAEYRVDGHL